MIIVYSYNFLKYVSLSVELTYDPDVRTDFREKKQEPSSELAPCVASFNKKLGTKLGLIRVTLESLDDVKTTQAL